MMTDDPFRTMVRAEGVRLYRDLPWRRTRDPYEIWLSEVMLQQTQVPRVESRWPAWLERFPSVFALAEAPTSEVLAAWQGMGYNRRALALKAAAERIVRERGGEFPRAAAELTALPGIGPATAQGIRAFAFDLPGVYLETNVRTVFLHHFFPDVPSVPDRELVPLVEAACPAVPEPHAGRAGGADGDGGVCLGADGDGGVCSGPDPFALPQDAEDTPRSWYYALLDYGAHLKRMVPNPSRRSKSYARQSRFEGSRRQKRAEAVRMLLDAQGEGVSADGVAERLNAMESAAGRPAVEEGLVASIMADLEREGFCRCEGGRWVVA